MPSRADRDRRRAEYFERQRKREAAAAAAEQAEPTTEAPTQVDDGLITSATAQETIDVADQTEQQAGLPDVPPDVPPDAPPDSPPDAHGVGVGELLQKPHIRRDCNTILKLMQAGVFTEKMVGLMFTRLGTVVAKGTNREAISAMKVLVAYAKAEKEAEQSKQPAQHLHLQYDGLAGMIEKLRQEGKIT